MSKALERCVRDQIIKYVTEDNFIDEYQVAFREGLNTQTAVIKLCDDIRSAINASEVTVAVFFDLSKAFNSVNHKRLLHKLLLMNFSTDAITWIRYYLTQRKQQMFAYVCASSWRNVLNGVPQGSVLGPLLFSLYISDPSQQLRCRYLLYADDLVIYLPCYPEKINDCVAALNAEIVKIVE